MHDRAHKLPADGSEAVDRAAHLKSQNRSSEADNRSARFRMLFRENPEMFESVARSVYVQPDELTSMLINGDEITVRVATETADHFGVDLHGLLWGRPNLDLDVLKDALLMTLRDVLTCCGPTRTGVAPTDPDLLCGNAAIEAWRLSIASHLTGLIWKHYGKETMAYFPCPNSNVTA